LFTGSIVDKEIQPIVFHSAS